MDILLWTSYCGHLTVDVDVLLWTWTSYCGRLTVDILLWTSYCGDLTADVLLWTSYCITSRETYETRFAILSLCDLPSASKERVAAFAFDISATCIDQRKRVDGQLN